MIVERIGLDITKAFRNEICTCLKHGFSVSAAVFTFVEFYLLSSRLNVKHEPFCFAFKSQK